MARRKKSELPKAELNITSMMDLVLNLLMFFVLVSNFAMAELPSMQPPKPNKSLARNIETSDKIVLNVIPEMIDRKPTGNASRIKFGANQEIIPSETGKLVEFLATEKNKSANVTIDLRADRALRYDQIQPVMAAITSAGISKINVVAQKDE